MESRSHPGIAIFTRLGNLTGGRRAKAIAFLKMMEQLFAGYSLPLAEMLRVNWDSLATP
ncbi:MAG TPA: hypothetical protein V6D14_32340 [Coleofasciculaceae cyanobacterium]|jgi:hypothetical protein